MIIRIEALASDTPYTGNSGLYSKVEPTPMSIYKLQEFAKKVGLKFNDDLHLTIMYSPDQSIPEDLATQFTSTEYNSSATKVRWWAGHDNLGYLVLEVDDKELSVEHNRFKQEGCVFTFPEYSPHITLLSPISFYTEEEKKELLDTCNMVLNNSPIELIFNSQVVEDIKP